MPNTYIKFYVHVIFAVKHRQSLLNKKWRNRVFAFIAATINERGNFSYAVNGTDDHIHLFFDYKSKEPLSDLVRELKKSSTKFINEKKLCSLKFQWQQGYGAFSISESSKDIIIKYVLNQEEHHKKKSFKDEFIALLNDYEINYKDEYLFEFFD